MEGMTLTTGHHIRQYGPQQVAKRLGVSVDTLKRWETAGAIPKAWRTPGGHRRYSEADLDAIKAHLDQTGRGSQHG